MKNINKLITLLSVSSLLLFSCSDDVLEVRNPNQPAEGISLDSEEIRLGVVNSIYKPMQSQGLYGRWKYLIEDLTSDEVSLTLNEPEIQRIRDYTLDNDANATTLFWQSCFSGIRIANDFINTFNEDDEDFPAALVAEARFLRGHYFFLLATRFGGVPLNLSSVPQSLPRSSYADTFNVIIEDFKFAVENLPERSVQDIGRPNIEVANAYLGKAYLFSIEPDNFSNEPATYDKAFEALSNVTSYSLADEYIDNFNYAGEYNNESLFEVDFERQNSRSTAFWDANLPNGITDVTIRSVDYSSWGNSQPTETLLDEYENQSEGVEDPRRDESFWEPGDTYGSQNNRIWGTDPDNLRGEFSAPASGTLCSRKYSEYIENEGSLEGSGINFRIIRYADVLLMKAEAALFKSSPDMGMAIDLMNEVRARPSVSMPPYPVDLFPVSTIDETFEALVHERRIELATEGKRTYDLGRWGRDLAIIGATRPSYNASRRFLPIPNTELLSNPNFGLDNGE